MVGSLHTRFRRALSLAVAAGLLLAACAPATPAGQPAAKDAAGVSAPAAPGKPAPVLGGRVIIGSIADAKVLNPVLSTDVTSNDVFSRLYAPLLQLDAKTGEPRPALAESFEMAPDGSSVRFVLREGATWSDGSPITGEDVAFTVEAVMRSQKTVRKSIFQDIKGAREYGDGRAERIAGIVVEGRAVTFNLGQAFCPALALMGNFSILPKSVFGKYLDPKDASKNLDAAPENTSPPLASGPFKFKEWIPNDRLTLERNDRYYGGRPNLDEWVLKVYPDATALASALKTGEIDVSVIEPKDLADVKSVQTLQVHAYPQTSYTFIQWNQLRGGKEFFQSKPIRQALAYGLNMDLVVERVLFGEGQKMVAHTPPALWAYDPEGLNPYPYDPAKAQRLIEAEGWSKGPDGIFQKDGKRLEFEILTNSGSKVRETLLQVAAEQYKQIGVAVTPKTESFEALVDRLNKSKDATYGDVGGRDFDAVILGWVNLDEPDGYSIWHSSQIKSGLNRVGYQNELVDRMLEQGRTSCGMSERKAAYKAFNAQLNEDQPYNFGFAPNALLAVSSRVQGVEPGAFSRLAQWNIDEWSVR